MATPLRVLIVEDSPDDAELLLRELRRGSYAPSARRVDSESDLSGAIEAQEWDVILCDYTMSGFSGTQALSLVRSRGLDVPLIFVSGTIGEDTAVAAMRAGAQDYVVKDNLRRLLPAIERELREAALRRDHARAEAKRRTAEARFRDILAMAPDAIVAVDRDRRVTVFNGAAETLFGYDATEMLGQPLDLILPSLPQPSLLLPPSAEASAGTPGVVDRYEIAGRRKSGEQFQAEASISRSIDDGSVTVLVILRDTTQRHLLEEQLRQAQKMEVIGQLTGGLAHDFNNLLTVIIGNLDVLQDQFEAGSQAGEMARLALDASLRGADLTRKLLAFSRRQSLEAKEVDLDALVSSTTDLLRRTLGEQVEIRMQLAGGLATALADPTQVEAALMNLALNARDAMPDGGCLTIETANKQLDSAYAAANADVEPGDYVMLAVSDTGSGIAPEILGKVFDPFFTTKDRSKGTGLGLSMVYGFAKQSGGHLKLCSELGRGTTARLYLPQADARGRLPGGGPAEEEQPGVGGATLLVVEDDADVRFLVVSLLRALGYAVVEAENARTALHLLAETRRVDLLFTDMVMPGGLSGLDLAREARLLRPSLKVLLTSGYAEAMLSVSATGDVVDGTLSKPYRKAELARKIQEVLSASPQGEAGGASAPAGGGA